MVSEAVDDNIPQRSEKPYEFSLQRAYEVYFYITQDDKTAAELVDVQITHLRDTPGMLA